VRRRALRSAKYIVFSSAYVIFAVYNVPLKILRHLHNKRKRKRKQLCGVQRRGSLRVFIHGGSSSPYNRQSSTCTRVYFSSEALPVRRLYVADRNIFKPIQLKLLRLTPHACVSLLEAYPML
jgi:hypothetical protein